MTKYTKCYSAQSRTPHSEESLISISISIEKTLKTAHGPQFLADIREQKNIVLLRAVSVGDVSAMSPTLRCEIQRGDFPHFFSRICAVLVGAESESAL